jgi:AAHS family benzoate transporter-like MFS transporter
MTNPVDDAVEKIGLGKQQIWVLVAGGCAYASTTAVSTTASQAARAVAAEAGMGDMYTGLLTSVVFGGYIIGNLLSGPFADGYGRRPPLVAAYAGLAVFQALAAAQDSSNILQLAICFLGCGVFMGLGLTGANANMKEWTPAHFRPTLFCLLFVFLASGQMGTCIFFNVTSPRLSAGDLQWKLLFNLQALLSGTLLLFCFFLLPESAQWLTHRGMCQKAKEALVNAAMRNGVELDKEVLHQATDLSNDGRTVEEATPLKPEAALSQSIFAGGLGQTTMIMCCLNICTNACYYGLMCTLPATLSASFQGSGITAANVMLILSLMELPGIALQDFLGQRLSRHANLAATFLAVSASLALLAGSLQLQPSLVLIGSMCCKLTIIGSFIITYLTMAEAYPVACRASGSGFCMTTGRLGACVAPVFYENLGDVTFYSMLSVLALVSAAAGYMLKVQESD